MKSAARVLDILDHVARHPEGASFSELGGALRIPKSSLHALLGVLVARHHLELDASSRLYHLGEAIWELGQAYPRHHRMIDVAQPVMRDVVRAFNETAQLARLSGRDGVYLAKVDSTQPLRLQSEAGSRLSAHATGVGKALLSGLADEEVARRFGDEALLVYTPTTLGSVDALLEELARIRARGFALDTEEYTPGVFCLAVPVLDEASAPSTALSVSIPVQRARRDAAAPLLAALARASLEISRRVGARRTDPRLERLAEATAAEKAIAALGRDRYALPWD